jgi:hypothetical protein
MATFWDRELGDEVRAGLGRLQPAVRLRLALRVLEWTVDALPESSRQLLAPEAGRTVDAALGWIRRAVAGEPVGDVPEELYDELYEWRDDIRVVDLWQLFSAVTWPLGTRAAKMSVDLGVDTLSACYDVIRDCAVLPDSDDEDEMAAWEEADPGCLAAVAAQRDMMLDAVRQADQRPARRRLATTAPNYDRPPTGGTR